MTAALPPTIFYPAQLPKFVILRNATFRKRFIVKKDGAEVDLTVNGIVIDADIKDSSGIQIATFAIELPEDQNTDPIPGMFDIELDPAATVDLPVALTHKTDISITFPDGDRFYYANADVEVRDTVSRSE